MTLLKEFRLSTDVDFTLRTLLCEEPGILVLSLFLITVLIWNLGGELLSYEALLANSCLLTISADCKPFTEFKLFAELIPSLFEKLFIGDSEAAA